MRTSTSEDGRSPPLRGGTAVEDFCRSLPRQDPIAAQRLLCEALSRLVANRTPDERLLGVLLAFERQAHQIGKRLLVQYAEGDAQLRSLDRRVFIAAQRLSRSFAQAYESFREHIEHSADQSWRKCADTVLVQLFRHRQVELLLRLFRYKKRNSEQWRQLCTAYRLARAQAIHGELPQDLADDKSAPERSLEQQFIQVLLLGSLNTGQFSPRELLWSNHWISRWSSLLKLQAAGPDDGARVDRNGFVVDLGGTEGPKRSSAGETGDFLFLDTGPLRGAIDQEAAALNDATDPDSPGSTEQDSRNALLSKLRMLFVPASGHIKRRGDRRPVAFSVQGVSGLPQIVQMLRDEAQKKQEQKASHSVQLDEITVSPTRGHTRVSTSVIGTVGLVPFSLATNFAAQTKAWQVKDRSDSGCRMRGQTADLNCVIPGTVIALREGENAEWTVAVVRRLRRLMIDHVEISVEHIGRKPRFVKMVNDCSVVPSAIDGPTSTQRTFGALYLPASEKHPIMPINTLVVPASVFNAGRAVMLLSSTATYTLRLNKPLEQQSDFVWTSFAVIDKVAATSPRMPGVAAARKR